MEADTSPGRIPREAEGRDEGEAAEDRSMRACRHTTEAGAGARNRSPSPILRRNQPHQHLDLIFQAPCMWYFVMLALADECLHLALRLPTEEIPRVPWDAQRRRLLFPLYRGL